jgi:hypothetical protein
MLLEYKNVFTLMAVTISAGTFVGYIISGREIKRIEAQRRPLLKDENPYAPEKTREMEASSPNADLILHLLLRNDEAEVLSRDLQERYSKIVKRLGKRRAHVWLWGQVLRSIWPLLKRFLTAGGFLAAAEFIRKLLS